MWERLQEEKRDRESEHTSFASGEPRRGEQERFIAPACICIIKGLHLNCRPWNSTRHSKLKYRRISICAEMMLLEPDPSLLFLSASFLSFHSWEIMKLTMLSASVQKKQRPSFSWRSDEFFLPDRYAAQILSSTSWRMWKREILWVNYSTLVYNTIFTKWNYKPYV